MEPRRYLRCLGQPALFAATGEPIRFRTRKHLALLIYIAVEARSHRRDRLAELLWPKVSGTEARHSLATALSILRPRLGVDGLEASRDHVRLIPGRVALDLDRLQAGDVLGSDVTGPLEVAAFLEGFDITDSVEFTHWKDRQQARLVPVIKDALLVLIDRCRRTGDSRQIEQLADRMLALDELSEEAIRAKMEARAFAGDRLTALEIFEEWRVKLADELQAVPSDLVEGMAVRLRRRGWERTTLANIPNVPTDQWRGRPFIGRTAEYRVLYEAWEGVRKGAPGHAFILGDSGVGKTTLVQRLTTAAGLEGAAISRVQCYDVEREIPYSTLSSLVLRLLDCPGVSATSPEALAELARTVSEVRHRFPNIPTSSDSQGETARIRLTEAFQEMLTAIAEEHPVILIIDDLHLADDVSLAVLHLIMRRSRGQAIMVLLIARPGELNQSSRASKLRESASSLGMREIDLSPLSDDESAEMLRSLVRPDEPQPSVAAQRALLRAAAGYPMVLELLVQDWKTSGDQSLALSVDAMTADFGTPGPAQGSYRKILDRITDSLDSTTRNVLNLASVLGHRLNDLSLYALVDLSTGQTMSSMAELVSRRVLRDGAQGLEFVNELVRAAAYLGVPPTLRRILHGNIADRFIQKQSHGDDDLGLEIAWHCIRAGRGAQATPYLLRGAREAIRAGAPSEAERGLSTAIPNLTGADKTEALLLLAEALQDQSRWDESLCFIDQIDRQQYSKSAELAFVLRTKARRRLGYVDSKELSELPAKLVAFIESPGDSSTRIRAAVELASVHDVLRCGVPTPSVLATLSSLHSVGLEIDDVAHLLLARAMLLYNTRDFSSSLECIHEARDILEKRNTPNSILSMLNNGIGAILTKQGDYSASIGAYLKCHQTAARVGNDCIRLQASANLALSLMRVGKYEEAIAWAEEPLAFSSTDLSPGFFFQAAESSLLSFAMLGRTEKAEEVIRTRRSSFANYGCLGFSQAWSLYSADAYAMLGKNREAEEEGRRATVGPNSQIHMDFCAGPYSRWVARMGVADGNVQGAYERLSTLVLNLGSYDAIDQADILNARCWLDSRALKVISVDMEKMQEHLETLPDGVRDQWTRMGMLDFQPGPESADLRSPFPETGCRPTDAF
jgi:DNA-binding SARP family transcriptional activator/type II secretory pathway predicted ATPase ExeA/tetratricopeptide (TPR) repeat protein